MLAHNTGFVETWYGEIHPEQPRFEIATDAVVRTATAKEYVGGKRLYGYVNGDLLYAYDMAAMGQELQPHTARPAEEAVADEPTEHRAGRSGCARSGHRLTPQRELVLAAVETLGHATPDEVLRRGAHSTSESINLSTVYRTLELLEELGLIRHAHLSRPRADVPLGHRPRALPPGLPELPPGHLG